MKTQQLLAMTVMLAACPAVEKTGEMGNGGGVPAEVQMRFDTYCQNNATCHVAGGREPDLTAANVAQSITATGTSGMQYVVIGDTANSFLAQKILPGAVGQMPPVGEPPLPPEDSQIILAWIAGAPFPEGDTDTDGMTTMMTTMMMPDMGMGEPQFCGLDVIDPAADVAAAVDDGDGAMQIPTVVGEALVRNCGCHYLDTIPMDYGLPYTGFQEMATLADFQGAWMGSLPADTGQPAYEAIAERIAGSLVMPPPNFCDADGEPSMENPPMTQEDYDLLQDWLGMGAPDGATYVPPA